MGTTIKSARRREGLARRQLRAARPRDIELAERVTNTLLRATDAITPEEVTQADVVIAGLVTNAANAYLKTLDLATSGYALLANGLVRLIYENMVSIAFIGREPARASRWVDKEATRRLPDMKDMEREVTADEHLREQLRTIRETLNLFAHASRLAWWRSHGLNEWGSVGYRLGPTWSVDELEDVLFPLLWMGSLVCDAVQDRYSADLDRSWVEEANAVGEAVHAWLDDYNASRAARRKS